jgi:hypothetical protein
MLYNINFGTGKLEAIDETDGDKNRLEYGRVLHLHGYNEPSYVVVANRGIDPKWTSYGAMYDCINLNTGETVRQQAFTLSWEKEKRGGIHVAITDKIMDVAEMATALMAARSIKEENDRIKKEKLEAEAKERAGLPARYPYLVPGTYEKAGAVNIRIELKREFPTVKFSVKIEHRGSSSININWTDGPTTEQVKKITGKYNQGNFNGMEDIYEYNKAIWPDIFGGARYVFENRHESPSHILRAAVDYGFDLSTGESDNYGILPGLDHEKSQMIYRHAREMAA